MPLTRYQIRNEYALADPELYKAADKDDPEALLEGVAMAGLVGVLRQLGDLAEFAAEIFHDLHEEVMTTAARGHGLMARVKQLEAEFPSIEKVLLSQTNHSPFFSSTGVDWHPHLQMEQTLITRGDLPRFVMDSYEECRGPPQLFLLDKFDVAGAGACLKRYTDPSFFKFETTSSGVSTVEIQREKKIRKAKKKGSRWRNGETPEVVPSHAKLHELFLEERVENGHSDPARLVKLKRRQLNGSTFDLKPGKSYMEKFVLTPSPEHKQVCEVSVTQSPLKLTLDDSSESGFDIHEVSVFSPVKRSSQGEESTSSSPNAQEVVLKPLTDEWNGKAIDKGIIKVLDPIAAGETDESSWTIDKKSIEEELSVEADGKQEDNLDGNHSDDMTSEVDNYMDALTTMDSEMDTDSERKPKGFMKARKDTEDSDSNEEHLDVQDNFSDSQSIANSSLSEDRNSLFKKGRSSFSYSDSLSNVAENAPSDGEGAAKVYASAENYATKDVDLPPSDNGSVNVESGRTESHQVGVVNDTCSEEDKIPDPHEASSSSCITDSNPMLLPAVLVANSLVGPLAGTELNEASSGCNKLGSESLNPVKNASCQANCLVALSDIPLQMGYGASHTVPSNCHPLDEVDHEDPYVLTDKLVHVSNVSDLASEMKIGDDSVVGGFQVQTDYSAEHFVEVMVASVRPAEEQFLPSTLTVVESDSSVTLPPDSSDSLVKPDGLVSAVVDVMATRDASSESSTPMLDTSETGSIKEHQLLDMKVNPLQGATDSTKLGGPCSEDKMKLEEISEFPDSEEKNGFMNKVDVVGGHASPSKHQSISSDQPNLDHDVNADDAVSEVVRVEDVAASTLATNGANDADFSNVIWPSADSVCSLSRNSMDMRESLSISEDPHQRKMHLDELIPTECLTESQVQMEGKQLQDAPIDWDSNPHNPVSEDHANLKVIEDVHEPSSELSNRESESKLNGQSHYVKATDDAICSRACYFSESGNPLEHSIDVQADRISIDFVRVEPEILLEHTLDTQPCQLDRGCLLLGDTSSTSTDIHSEQIQDQHHITEERHLDTSCLRDFPSLENNATGLSTNPLDSAFPSFSLLPQASNVNPEAMPPLPPLPPMEWRIGKFQPAPPDVQRNWIDHSAGASQLIQPITADQNIQFDLPSSDREILHPSNPYLSVTGDSQKSQQLTTDLLENSSLPAPLLSEMPIPENDDKNQLDDLPADGTHSVNSFLTSPEMPEHGFLESGEEPTQCSLNPFSLEAGVEAAALSELVPTQGLPIHPSNRSADLEVKVPEQSSQNAEGEQGNPSAKPAVPLTMEDEHHRHDFITSPGETMLPLTTLALARTYEVGKPNGNKIPRPRNPLIDAVAAHDKSKLRKVAERVKPQLGPKAEERDSLLEQIRTKSFNLKPATVTTRPSIQGIQGPKTNLKVAAILEKANAIRQALTGSDEDEDSDSWSDT